MLTDAMLSSAHTHQVPLLSPKGISVWVKEVNTRLFLDEEAEAIIDVEVALYIDDRGLKRVMDTHTFKEVFKEVEGCPIPKQTKEQRCQTM